MPHNITINDRIEVPSVRTKNSAGQMIIPCTFARTGVQKYLAGSLGLYHLDAADVVDVYREETEVFNTDSIESFRSSPVTLGHPRVNGEPIKVSPENAKEYQMGMLEGIPVRDEDFLKGTIVVTNQEAMDAIEDGTKQLSPGYVCDILMKKDDEGNERYYQSNIRGNHIAIVDKGRGGTSVTLADDDSEKLAIQDELKETKKNLLAATTKLKAVSKLKEALKVSDEKDVNIEDLEEIISKKVDERCAVIEKAKSLTDELDFTGDCIVNIQRKVVASCLPEVSLTDKDDLYIKTRFDILVEDIGSGLKKVLKTDITTDLPAYKDPVKEARIRMIKRNAKG